METTDDQTQWSALTTELSVSDWGEMKKLRLMRDGRWLRTLILTPEEFDVLKGWVDERKDNGNSGACSNPQPAHALNERAHSVVERATTPPIDNVNHFGMELEPVHLGVKTP